MLDVHPPHTAIHGAGEFFLHLFTITVGLLIAVGIEGAVERHQHRELASAARDVMTEEVKKNKSNLADALKSIDQEEAKLSHNLSQLRTVQLNPKDAGAAAFNLDISYETTGLEDTGWRTAQATGALAYMPYSEAKTFSGIYTSEEQFTKAQDQLAEDAAHALGVIQKFHIGHGPISKEGADAMAEQFGVWQGHLLGVKIAARVLQEQQTALLEGREAKSHMSERMSSN